MSRKVENGQAGSECLEWRLKKHFPSVFHFVSAESALSSHLLQIQAEQRDKLKKAQ